MQRVEVGIVDSRASYMSSTRHVHEHDRELAHGVPQQPGHAGVELLLHDAGHPAGRLHGAGPGGRQARPVTPVRRERHVTVTHPRGQPRRWRASRSSCKQNVCTFDARGSTDENAPTLTYSWNFGNGTGSGPLPTRTYTAANTYTVTLTARDEWGLTGTATQTVTITEPTSNVPPKPVINPPACVSLVCNFSGVGSADPNTGDTFTYLWNFGDGTPTSTSSARRTRSRLPALTR